MDENEKMKPIDRLKAFSGKAKEKLKTIPKKIIIIVASVLVVLLIAIVVLLSNRPYSVLFTGLSSSDLSSVTSYLETQGVTDYKIENNDTVLVRKDREASLKAGLLMEGYPQTGFSYSYDTYYNNVGSLSTESERKTAFLHDLQDQMSAVVRCFDNVKNATVNIAMAEDSSYILDSSKTSSASASVVVEMVGSTKLTSDQATAIRNYIAHAVQGLTVDEITITDTLGNRYGVSTSLADADASALKFQLEEEQSNVIRTEVMQALLPFYGDDNVRVAVSCTVDVSQRTVNSHDVTLPDYAADGSTNGEGIKGEKIYEYYVNRQNDDAVGGLVGSETNSDLPEYVEDESDPNGSEQELGGSGTVKYDNSYEDAVTIYTAGYLTDCSISVSINASAASVNVDEIRRHVARAAGIQGVLDETTGEEYLEDKISVIAAPFYEEPNNILPDTSELPVPLWVIIAAGVGLLVFLVLLIVLLRRRKKKKKAAQEQANQVALEEFLAAAGNAGEAINPETGADVMSLKTERSMELRKEIRQFTEANPEIAAQMLRGWLRGGEDND